MSAAATALVVRVQPASIIHDEPEGGGFEFAQVGNDKGQHAFDALIVEGSRKMVIVDQIMMSSGPQDHGDHMSAEKSTGLLTSLLTPVTSTLLHFS
jgi:hypothetical protein